MTVSRSLNNLCTLMQNTEHYAGARPYYKQALAILEEVLPLEHEYIRTVRGNLEAVMKKLEGK